MPITSFRTPSLMLEDKRERQTSGHSPAHSHNDMATRRGVLVRSHAGRCQVRVLVLQFAVQSDAPPLPVIGQQGEQLVDLLKGRAGRHRVPETKRHTETIGPLDWLTCRLVGRNYFTKTGCCVWKRTPFPRWPHI